MTNRSGILLPANLMAVWLMLASAWQVLAVDPVVSNVQAKQREGSRLVDITYDVADPDSPTLTVYLKVSADGGKTWKGPVELVSGDVGLHIVPGTGKRLVWNAGKEMGPNQYWPNLRYRIGASDVWMGEPNFAFIPAGAFKMGSDLHRESRPAHTVILSAFAIEKFEVTIEVWEAVRSWGNIHGYDLEKGDTFGEKHPVRRISWWDAVKWCNARSEMERRVPAYYEDSELVKVYRTGKNQPGGINWKTGYRLPTEAEWEKAARGGVEEKMYPWETDEYDLLNKYGNYGGKNEKTMPVGSYAPNGYGVYDMAGNVWEWCWDWYVPYTSEAQSDPRGPNTGVDRVYRGGSWQNLRGIKVIRQSNFGIAGDWQDDFGFRTVLPEGQP